MPPEDEVLAPFVEAGARARYESDALGAFPDELWEPWEECDRTTRGMYLADARIALRAALSVEPTKACETCEGTGRLCSEHERAYCPCDSLWIVCPDCGSSPAAGRVSDPEGVRLIVGQWAGAVTDKQFDFDDNLVGIVARGEGIAHADFGAAVFLAVAPETGSEKP